jgi:hypothetical protein
VGFAIILGGCTAEDHAAPQVEEISTKGLAPAAAPSAKPVVPPLDSGVVFRLCVDSARVGNPALELETNLPDGTEVMFGLTRLHSVDNPMGAGATVRGGVAREEGFGGNTPLQVGTYEADATMPYPYTQSRSRSSVRRAKVFTALRPDTPRSAPRRGTLPP